MAGGIDWLRWHHGTATDAKFRLVAKRASARFCEVLAFWAVLMEAASQSVNRGDHGELDLEAIDCALDFEEGTSGRLFAAMTQRKLIAKGRLVAWDKRQPKREREDNSADRVAAFRAKSRHVTPCNANGDQETPREEKRREEALDIPPNAERTIGSTGTDSAPADSVGAFEGHDSPECEALTRSLEAVQASKQLRAAGCTDCSGTDAHLVAALADGLTVPELVDVARSKPGKGIAYICQAARGKRADAASRGGPVPVGPTRNVEGPSPRLSPAEEAKRKAEALTEMERQHRELGYGAH